MKIDRTTPPALILPTNLSLPQQKLHTTATGILLHTIEVLEQPVVRLSLVFKVGSMHQNHPFEASTMLNMLSEGSLSMSSADMAKELDFYGVEYECSIDRDFSMITVSCLSKFLPETLGLLEEIVLRPAFLVSELDIYKTKRKQQLRMERQRPSYMARELFTVAIFGADHPYGVVSQEECYDTLTSDNLREFYQRYFGAENCFAVASGFLQQTEIALICGFLEKIPHVVPFTCSYLEQPVSVSRSVLSRPNDVQSSLRIGKLLFPKGHPDYNGMQLLVMVLGGYFGSRLVQNLREEHGYTYGIYSTIATLRYEGYLAIATDVSSEFTAAAVKQIFIEIERLRTQKIDSDELIIVKNMIVGELMRVLDGPFGIADVIVENIESDLPADYFNQFLQDVKQCTPEYLQSLAIKYLNPDSFTTVIVGRTE
ncbi:MAG: pitrilysin family protein [Mucinivorans sp.]